MPRQQVAIVIPIYKPTLSQNEQISLDRCLNVLGRHPVVVIAPEGLALDGIDFQGKPVTVRRFAPEYFAGIAGYNRLMMSAGFYREFLDYRYILIYQLDAFVFSDSLLEWCALDYDYIGAPWVGVN